jgi:hypothetical protein
LRESPKANRNMLTRALQKQRIKKEYAKAVRETQKSAVKAKRAGTAAKRIGKALVTAIKRHPVAAIAIVITGLLLFMFMSVGSTVSSSGITTVSTVVYSTYLSDDEDMLGAESVYSAMEDELQDYLDNYETYNPGYDEYIYELDTIWHDPYVLISILSVLHDGLWTLGGVQGTFAMLFEKQYIMTETETVETRTKTVTETVTDPETGDTYMETVIVEYDYYIMTVTLENFNLSHLPVFIMNEERLSYYALLMRTLGNRPDLFPNDRFPNASFYREYGKHDIPSEYFNDERFAAMIREAEKYLGYPYVWGGSNPSTSFDCSGFVSWVLNRTGWNIGRLGAKGLYNYSTPVSASSARPGDLVFFNYTYNAPEPHLPTHVGIYVGDGMMIHAGNPIGYTSIETPYWKKHFFAFGRIY